jgi:hypothetical protein
MELPIENIRALDPGKIYVVELSRDGVEAAEHYAELAIAYGLKFIFTIKGLHEFINVPEGYEIKKVDS